MVLTEVNRAKIPSQSTLIYRMLQACLAQVLPSRLKELIIS